MDSRSKHCIFSVATNCSCLFKDAQLCVCVCVYVCGTRLRIKLFLWLLGYHLNELLLSGLNFEILHEVFVDNEWASETQSCQDPKLEELEKY